jgi:fructokinase
MLSPPSGSLPLVGAVEAGGTKFVCAVAAGPDDVRAIERVPTTDPSSTLAAVVAFLQREARRHGGLAAVGVGSFGPIDPDPRSPDFGRITATPKAGWSHTDVVGPIRAALGVPVAFDTDVNAALWGEAIWGAATDVDNALYLTVGTGIGGGAMVERRLVHGLIHPEMGHIRLPRDVGRDPFPGACPFHGDCLEGLASGPAVARRWGAPAEQLPPDHPAWDLEAEYLALAVHNFVCTLSPQRIILGGGVMEQPGLLPTIRRRLAALLAGYVKSPAVLERLDGYVVGPGLGNRSGLLGAAALAQSLHAAQHGA